MSLKQVENWKWRKGPSRLCLADIEFVLISITIEKQIRHDGLYLVGCAASVCEHHRNYSSHTYYSLHHNNLMHLKRILTSYVNVIQPTNFNKKSHEKLNVI